MLSQKEVNVGLGTSTTSAEGVVREESDGGASAGGPKSVWCGAESLPRTGATYLAFGASDWWRGGHDEVVLSWTWGVSLCQ
mgnify:FL=1